MLASLATNAIHSLFSNTASAGAALLFWFCTWVLGLQVWPSAEWETSNWLLASLATKAIHSLFSNSASAGAALLDWFCTWELGLQVWPSADWLMSSWLLASLATNPSVKPCGPELTNEIAGDRLLDSFPTWVLGCQFLPSPELLTSSLFVSLFETKARYMLMVIPLPNPRHPRRNYPGIA